MQSCINSNKLYNNINLKKQDKTAFKGGMTTSVADAATYAMKKVETGGILVDFLGIDLLGCILPRIYAGYNRNKEELGHPNYKAAVEEAIRELSSGPGLFIIPSVLMLAATKMFGPASNIQFKTLRSLTGSFRNLLEKNTANAANSTILREKFYKNVLDEAFAEHKKLNICNVDGEINKIVGKIFEAEKVKKKGPYIADIKNIVSDLNKSHGLHLNNSFEITMKDGHTKHIGNLVPDMIYYGKDVVAKVSERSANGAQNKLLPQILNEIEKFKDNGRKANLAATFLASSAFLYCIPLMYQRNKEYPGVAGLKCDGKNPSKQCAQINKAQKVDDELNRPVLFSSSANKTTPTQGSGQSHNSAGKVSFGSNGSFSDRIFVNNDFNKYSAPHAVLGAYMTEVVFTRMAKGRDENETRDVIIRDIPSVISLILALPAFRNVTATMERRFFGVPVSSKLKSTASHINPKNHPFTFENLTDIYSEIHKYRNNIVDFSKNIDNNGGDLRKVFDLLSNDSKAALNKIAHEAGANNTPVKSGWLANTITGPFKAGKDQLILPSTNKEIISMFEKAQTGSLRSNLDVVLKEMASKKNPVVKFTHGIKSIPEVINIVIVSAIMGYLLPWFNTHNTKKHMKNLEEARVTGKPLQDNAVNKFTMKLHNALHNTDANKAG